MENKLKMVKYFWRIVYSYTIASFIAGLFLALIAIRSKYFPEIWSFFEPYIKMESSIFPDILYAIILGLIILPLQKAFFEEEKGLTKLGIVIFGLSNAQLLLLKFYFTDEFMEKIPYLMLIIIFVLLLELLKTVLLIGILKFSIKYDNKKTTIISIIIMVIIGIWYVIT